MAAAGVRRSSSGGQGGGAARQRLPGSPNMPRQAHDGAGGRLLDLLHVAGLVVLLQLESGERQRRRRWRRRRSGCPGLGCGAPGELLCILGPRTAAVRRRPRRAGPLPASLALVLAPTAARRRRLAIMCSRSRCGGPDARPFEPHVALRPAHAGAVTGGRAAPFRALRHAAQYRWVRGPRSIALKTPPTASCHAAATLPPAGRAWSVDVSHACQAHTGFRHQ